MNKYTKQYAIEHQQNPLTYWEYKEIFRLYTPKKSDAILDIGCNTGDLLHLLEHKGYTNLTGIDINKDALKIAKNKTKKAQIMYMDITKDKPKKTFDCIYLLHVLEHIENSHAFLARIKQLLKENGVLIISTPNALAIPMKIELGIMGKKHCYDPTHVHFLKNKDIRRKLKEVEFKIINYSTLPLDLVTQIALEKWNIRIPAGKFGGHNYVVARSC